MIESGGLLVKNAATTLWSGTTAEFPGFSSLGRPGGYWASYAEMYVRHSWVSTVIDKLAWGEARLPLKVYQRDDLNRPEAPDSPYAQLLRNPNPRMGRFQFWLWVVSTFDVFGDTVNLASRMETSATPGEINLSAYTYDLVRDEFDCEYRGKLEIKGKGALDLYTVRGRK